MIFSASSEAWMKASLLILHVILLMFAWAIMRGASASIIPDVFNTTMWSIVVTLGVLSGNKALQKVADKAPFAKTSTMVTSTTTEAPAAATPAPTPATS